METSETKKVTKPAKKSSTSPIRVSQDTRKRVLSELIKINKKSYGKRVKVDALILKLLTKLSAQDVAELQEASLSGRDRLEQNYRAYCAKFGSVTMDQFLELISRETMPQMLKAEVTKNHSQNGSISEGKTAS